LADFAWDIVLAVVESALAEAGAEYRIISFVLEDFIAFLAGFGLPGSRFPARLTSYLASAQRVEFIPT
jgi:hypothetical protein